MQRIIMHIDLDQFYAALEEIRNPSLKGKPVVVCVYSGRTSDSGAVSTANYTARKLGIRAGIPISHAKNLAEKSGQEVVFLPVDMDYYREISERIMEILESHADILEQASIDEAYLDVTGKTKGSYNAAEIIAGKIKEELKEKENLACSIGIAPNKLVAKIASDFRKPDGLTIVMPDEVENFLKSLPLRKIHGIGPKTIEALESIEISTVAGLADCDIQKLIPLFGGNKARLLIDKAKGIDYSSVEEKEAKQISRILTLKNDTNNIDDFISVIDYLSAEIKKKLEKKKASFKTISVIAIDTTLDMQTRSRTLENATTSSNVIKEVSTMLTKEILEGSDKKLRRFGLRISSLDYGTKKEQKSLADF